MFAAGCLGADAPIGGSSTPPTVAPSTGDATPPTANGTLPEGIVVATNVTYVGCVLQPANVPLPEADARALLPEGFTPLPFQGIPGTATGVLFAMRCARAGTGLVEETDVVELGAYLGVEPPQDLRADGVDGYRFLLSHVIASESLAASYAAMGHFATTGEVRATFARSGATTTGDASVISPELSVTLRTAVADTGPTAGAVLRFFEARDGLVASGVDFALSDGAFAAGEASYTVDAGAPPFGSASGGAAAGFHYEWAADAVSLTITPFALSHASAGT